MGLFGKSEDELKRIAVDMDKRQTALDNRESDVNSKETNLAHERNLFAADKGKFDSERSTYTSEVQRVADSMAMSNADLEKLRTELTLKEAEAKVNFAGSQRETFRSVVEQRQAELDIYQSNLDELAADIAKRMEVLHSREGNLAKRELAVIEREMDADVGFADRTKALADNATRQHHANLAESARLEKLAAQLETERQAIEEKNAGITRREQAVFVAEQTRDAGFADERAAFNAEMRGERANMESEISDAREKKHSALEYEFAALKSNRLEAISQAEHSERERIHAEIAKEREIWTKQQDDTRKQLDTERTEFQKQKGVLTALQSQVEGRVAALEASERTLERKEQRLEQQWQKRNDELEEFVEARFAERRKSQELADVSLREELSRLRETVRSQTELLGGFEQLKRQLGGKDPAEIIRSLNSQTDELKLLREELATRPTEEMRERYQVLETKEKYQKARADQLEVENISREAAVAEVTDLRYKNSEFSAANKSLAQKASIFEGAAVAAQAELNRLRAAYERPAEVAERYKEIELPHFKADKFKQPVRADIDEMTWLTGIGNACDSYGLHFNPRILKAFHTALKTAEWSPLTILAGVSGTGKSELPRLYSHFGGIFFEPLSVQPNWDSQESMLGFFNSIDNKFDAQPVLRFLAQSQKKWAAKTDDSEGYPGLSDAVCLVLLDEMNLAHPELYFAEFLSKLELRRGKKGAEVPFLPVKIGAGLTPYELPLGRNVLWTGTMNQDETTKSLSDKVIDRSIIINFPRPNELKSRELKNLTDTPFVTLHRSAWESWWVKKVEFESEQITLFRNFIEKMNDSLEVAGRAIGHRVWQSIEYYMANYPDVRAAQRISDKDALAKAMHIAFEDQLVQKIMPKLRGIDTRGKSMTDCLEKIRGQIVAGVDGNSFNLAGDFAIACELGNGQFIWQSANYLNAANPVTVAKNAVESEITNASGVEEPPALFQKDQLDQKMRHLAWNKKTPVQRNELRKKLEENLIEGRIIGIHI